MTTPTVPDRLKALRERAGISIREMARRLDMSPSTYNHYESNDRFKARYLPMDIAQRIARAMTGGASSDQAEVLALAGAQAAQIAPNTSHLAEDAAPFVFREQPIPVGAQHLTLRAVFGDRAPEPATYRITHALPGLGLWPGDVAVVTLSRNAQPGELAIVGLPDGSTGVRRFLPPYLLTGQPDLDAIPLRSDQDGVTIRFPVIGSIRGIA